MDIDESEQTLWYRVGELAYATKNNRLARLAYEHGLYIIAIREKYPDQFDEDVFNENTGSILNFWNELEQIFLSGRISPIQWRCFEGLCQVRKYYLLYYYQYRKKNMFSMGYTYIIIHIIGTCRYW